MLRSGLKANVFVPPPHRMPTSVTLPEPLYTGEPLSPLPTAAATNVWQSCMIWLPCTEVFTQVFVTWPVLVPVVRPVLLTVAPTATGVRFASASLVMLCVPVMVRLLPLVEAMPPRSNAVLFW